MREREMPVHARARVGPLSAGTLAAKWPRGFDCESCRPGGRRSVTGALLVADDRAPARWLESADVIVAAGEAGSSAPGEWLRRYPGCAVAAGWAKPGVYFVATGDGGLHLAVSGHSAVGASAVACAVFVHGWLVTGWPLALLRPACLHVGHSGARMPMLGSPLFFSFSYCPASGDDPGLEPPALAAPPDNASQTC
jgi:hypothetical protein